MLVVEKAGGGLQRIDCLEKNLQTSYCAPPLYFSHPSVESQLALKTDTVPPSNIITRSPRRRKTHDRNRPPRGQYSTRGNRRKDAQVVRNRKRMRKHNQRETTYVTMTGERTHKKHKRDYRGTDAQAYPNGNKEKDLDQPAVGFEGYRY